MGGLGGAFADPGPLSPLLARSLKPSVQRAWPRAGACWSRDILMLERTSKGQRLPGPLHGLGWGASPAACCPHDRMTPPRFEINFLSEAGDIAFHVKPRFSSATMVGNAFQAGRWGQEEVSSVFPLTLGEPFEVTGSGGGPWGREAGVGRPWTHGATWLLLWLSVSPGAQWHCGPRLGPRGRLQVNRPVQNSSGGGCGGMSPAPGCSHHSEEQGRGHSERLPRASLHVGAPRGEGPQACPAVLRGLGGHAERGQEQGGPRPRAGRGSRAPCPQMEVSSDSQHFHVHAQEHKVMQFAHRHRPLAAVTRVQVLSDHRLAQVELARRGLSWG